MCKVIPNSDDPEKFKMRVNGKLVTDPVVLNHGDRVVVGNHHYFMFIDPKLYNNEEYDWEDAMKEANADQLQMFDNGTDEMVKELKEKEEKLKKEAEEKEKKKQEEAGRCGAAEAVHSTHGFVAHGSGPETEKFNCHYPCSVPCIARKLVLCC